MTDEAGLKLFMVLVGGRTQTSNIELHDIRFAVARTLKDTYPALRDEWWGEPDSLHIDAWAEIACIDGYDISLSPLPRAGREKLYFVNLGGYDTSVFDEQHRNILKVATSKEAAKAAALADVKNWTQPHKDNLYEVENILALKMVGGLHVHLAPSPSPVPFSFHCRYSPISEKALFRRPRS